eukprot:4538568-Amphidinium_carterae.1
MAGLIRSYLIFLTAVLTATTMYGLTIVLAVLESTLHQDIAEETCTLVNCALADNLYKHSVMSSGRCVECVADQTALEERPESFVDVDAFTPGCGNVSDMGHTVYQFGYVVEVPYVASASVKAYQSTDFALDPASTYDVLPNDLMLETDDKGLCLVGFARENLLRLVLWLEGLGNNLLAVYFGLLLTQAFCLSSWSVLIAQVIVNVESTALLLCSGFAQAYLVEVKWIAGSPPRQAKARVRYQYSPNLSLEHHCCFACMAYMSLNRTPSQAEVRRVRQLMSEIWLQHPERLAEAASELHITPDQYVSAIRGYLWGGVRDLHLWSDYWQLPLDIEAPHESFMFGKGKAPKVVLKDSHFSVVTSATVSKWSARALRKAITRTHRASQPLPPRPAKAPCGCESYADRGGMMREERVLSRTFVAAIRIETHQAFLRATAEVCTLATQVLGATVGFFHTAGDVHVEYVLTDTVRATSPVTMRVMRDQTSRWILLDSLIRLAFRFGYCAFSAIGDA